ncbi:hypothetical protein [Sphingomonas crusticola]|uniref:hypothetical protein n=1 Tax=Sphingomonas crusticola TaxID=1697973 RepID=UPI0013C36C8E|nr:hypothetical protein [Sphingomonas crusticola]
MFARNDDQNYFLERERQARAMAASTTDPAVHSIHLRFAEAYARRARAEATRDSQVAA